MKGFRRWTGIRGSYNRKPFNDYKILNNEESEFYVINRKNEQFTIKVDTEDLTRLIKFGRPWHVAFLPNSSTYYASCCERLKTEGGEKICNILYLHRWVLNYSGNNLIDHVDHDPLNNRKINLRITDIPDNSKHRGKRNKNNKSGYRNVCWHTRESKWCVQLMINGKNTVLGKFDNVDEAGIFAEQMRKKYYGEFAGGS